MKKMNRINDKLFKWFCVVLSAIIIFSSVLMVFALPGVNDKTFDIFGSNQIIDDIRNLEMNMTSVIYVKDKKNDKWKEYKRLHGTENRIWVSYTKIPDNLINAFVAIEDERFDTHYGVDWKRTVAAFVNSIPGINLYSTKQGGSTITQQLIKNITSDNEDTATRKFREITRALLVEKNLSKQEILEAYLNTISLGSGICGVQVASNYYFNKDVSDLSLLECAAIAGITKNPSAYNPDLKPEGNKKRRKSVLKKMFELGYISEEEYLQNVDAELVIDKTQVNSYESEINDYFIDALIEEVSHDLAIKYNCSDKEASTMIYNGGYKIYSTMDPTVQKQMEKVYNNVPKYFSLKSKLHPDTHVQSAMTILDYNGCVLGVVGGVGEKTQNRGLNRAFNSPRQPGSTMKPLGVYSQAIENKFITYSSIYEDKPIDNYYGDGKKGPKEWYGYYAGSMTVKSALERSANTIPCWILRDSLGVENSYNFLTEKLHLNHLTELDKNISALALGGTHGGITTLESASAFAIFGNGGVYHEPKTYYKVENTKNEIILQNNDEGEQVISPETATIMNHLLQNVVYGSMGTAKAISGYSKMKVYAKTGTSSDVNDLWLVGGTPYYIGSVWYGFDQNENMPNSNYAANVWNDIMSELHKNLEYKAFEDNTEVVKAYYCPESGLRSSTGCTESLAGYYLPDTVPEYCKAEHTPLENDPSAQVGSSQSGDSISDIARQIISSITDIINPNSP